MTGNLSINQSSMRTITIQSGDYQVLKVFAYCPYSTFCKPIEPTKVSINDDLTVSSTYENVENKVLSEDGKGKIPDPNFPSFRIDRNTITTWNSVEHKSPNKRAINTTVISKGTDNEYFNYMLEKYDYLIKPEAQCVVVIDDLRVYHNLEFSDSERYSGCQFIVKKVTLKGGNCPQVLKKCQDEDIKVYIQKDLERDFKILKVMNRDEVPYKIKKLHLGNGVNIKSIEDVIDLESIESLKSYFGCEGIEKLINCKKLVTVKDTLKKRFEEIVNLPSLKCLKIEYAIKDNKLVDQFKQLRPDVLIKGDAPSGPNSSYDCGDIFLTEENNSSEINVTYMKDCSFEVMTRDSKLFRIEVKNPNKTKSARSL